MRRSLCRLRSRPVRHLAKYASNHVTIHLRGHNSDVTCVTFRHSRPTDTAAGRVVSSPRRLNMAPATSSRTLAVLAVAGIGALAYAVYFDHKRRTDAGFRKRLRMSDFVSFIISHLHLRLGREKKKIDKSVAQETTSTPASGNPLGGASVSTAEIVAAMKSVKDDQVPTTPEVREKYFMAQVEQGEMLCAKGVFSAPCFAAVHLLTALYRSRLCNRGSTGIFQSPSRLSLARRVDYDLPKHCTRAYFQSVLHHIRSSTCAL